MSWPVFITPSRMVNRPGKRVSQAALAAGTNCRALASMPALPGTRAAMPAEWISEAPGTGQVLHGDEHAVLLRGRGHQHRLASVLCTP